MDTLLKISDLLTLSRRAFPAEICGFLLHNGGIYQCKNQSPDPHAQALISAEDYAAADTLGILAIYHSHTQLSEANFSPADARAAMFHQLPIIMINAVTGEWLVADPVGTLNLPYEGLTWLYGVQDCYSLVSRYLRDTMAINLPPWTRGDESEWESASFNPFIENYTKYGFQRLSVDVDLQHGDIFLIQQGDTPTHLGVLCDAQQGHFLHHLQNRQSEKAIWGGYWRKHCVGVFRHG